MHKKMPIKSMFEDESVGKLYEILELLNKTMAGINNVKTVEQIQDFIFNLNVAIAKIKEQIQNV